jgi:hypothetical protein
LFVVWNLLTKGQKAAHAKRLRIYQDTKLNVTEELSQAAEYNFHEQYVVSKILGARSNEQEMFHELPVAWRGFTVGEATWEPYASMTVYFPEMVTKIMKSTMIQTWTTRYNLFESSHGEVLCCAWDESSVVIKPRNF